MYDQIAVLALIEPAIIARSEEMPVDVEIDHGASYGAMLHWPNGLEPPEGVRAATVQLDLNYPRFIEAFLELMKRPLPSPVPTP